MSIRKRIEKLEDAYKSPNGSGRRSSLSDEEFLQAFEDAGKSGYFNGEPDFPASVASYRKAILDAAHADPPFNPPDDFMLGMPENQRQVEWRRGRRYPGVEAEFFWMTEMYDRVRDGKPPVTVAEFRDLEEWFRKNEDRLPRNESLDIGGGRRTDRGNLRYNLSRGPKNLGVTELVEDLRRLRELLE